MNIKRTQSFFIAAAGIFIIIILFLGWLSSKQVREVVTDNFNQQQLVLARNSAKLIEYDIKALTSQLNTLAAYPNFFSDIKKAENFIKIAYMNMIDKGCLEIKYIDRLKLTVHKFGDKGLITAMVTSEDIIYLKRLKIKNGSDQIFVSDVFLENIAGHKRPIVNFAKPVKKGGREFSTDRDNYLGILVFVIDAYSLTSKVTQDIISGKTGYAFIIDQKNIFLYHHEYDFIGRDSNVVRREKSPYIPFERINEIQTNYMLKGKEGTDWYISGWHRGEFGEMKKLIAYTPIHLTEAGNKIWSIAVVAPANEVEDAIHSIQIRQFSLQMLIIFGILIFGLLHIHMLTNWSTSLQYEVEKKTLEFKLSEEKYRSLIENADDIIFTVDNYNKFLSMNKYGCNFFKKNYNDIVGHNIEDIIPHPFVEVVSTMIEDVFTSEESLKFSHFFKIDDEEYWMNTIMRRLYDEEGKAYAVLGISRDITATKKKQMEERIMYHTEKLASMGTLAAGVAHEINNPLAIILGFSDLLLEKTSPDSSEYEILKIIEKQALNAKKVVEGLLSFARYSEQKDEVLDINKNIEAVLSIVKNTLVLNNISLKSELHPDLPHIKGDPGKFQQVFLNIINNAIHAMKGGGVLTVGTRLVDDAFIEIKFSDTGHGIKPEHRSKIFDPLFTTKKVGEGTGLGLFVCYGIITQYGGKITFETKTIEESSTPGTTFIITLPVVKEVS